MKLDRNSRKVPTKENPAPEGPVIPEKPAGAAVSEKNVGAAVPSGPVPQESVGAAVPGGPSPEELPWRMVGEVLHTYIVVEQGDRVFFIDKHAAHERMNFDRMKAQGYDPMAQTLLSPALCRLPAQEQAVLLAHHGSKSVTIGNITDAYNKAAHGNGFNEEFVYSDAELQLIDKYADTTDELHTDLHECLGHGSGKLLPGVDPDALKAYGSTIEEARADLFGLYYVADPKLVELGLTPSADAYKAQFYTYLMNGLMTQLVRIEPGNNVEEAHMRNRQLIARWVYEKGAADKVVELVKKDGKTYVVINDYEKVRELFGELLAEIQRIKSTGDYDAARELVESYAVKVDPELHAEVLERYKKLNLAPYKGFVNPKYEAVTDADGNITDVKVTYDEGYAEQMLRYSKDYSALPSVND